MDVLKVYIVQSIASKTGEQIETERENAIKDVNTIFRYADIEFINDPCFDFSLEALGKSIIKMAEADFIYFVKGWKHDCDCSILHDGAVLYDAHIIEQE